MLRTAGRQIVRPQRAARLFSTASHRPRTNWNQIAIRSGAAEFTYPSIAVVAAAICAYYALDSTVSNEARETDIPRSAEIYDKNGPLTTLVWGSNKNNVLNPESGNVDVYRTPVPTAWSQNVALRDLALHEKHAACVDARGDVYQWGEGFYPSSNDTRRTGNIPTATLRGKNIVGLQLTDSRVFALSASGRIYVLAAKASEQSLTSGKPTKSSASWWSPGPLSREEQSVDFTEIMPRETLRWGEKFVSISAGQDHLLALTSSGRTFAHPITLNANKYGQLGIRKVDFPDRSTATAGIPNSRIPVELTPKSIVDPYARVTPHVRPTSSMDESKTSTMSSSLDDGNIRFSDSLFEVPSLKDVKISKIATGGRSSFVLTQTGRLLGWGANEYGQIGLGRNVTLDTITVPTEIVVKSPTRTETRCTQIYAGGDLTGLVVEHMTRDKPTPTVELMMFGNGQWGGLGNNQFSNAQGTPVRVRNVSGLVEYNDKTNSLHAIYPDNMSISPSGHVLLTLDTLARSGPGAGGKDLYVWGTNHNSQLGNGRRTSLASPTALTHPGGEERFMLMRRQAAEVRDMSGKVWKKGAPVEQVAVAGYGNSVVYWRIC